MSIIYCAEHIESGRIYIGKTKQSLEKRKGTHYSKSKNGSKNYFHRALKKYSKDDFIWGTIEEVENQELLNEREIYWIKEFNSFNRNLGFNLTTGGDGCPATKEIKEKLSKKRKEWWAKKENKDLMKIRMKETEKPKRIKIKYPTGEKHQGAKKVKCVETNEIFNCIKDAADKYQLHATHIVAVCRGRLKTTGKKHWIYA